MTEIQIKKSTLYIFGIILLVVLGGFFFLKGDFSKGETPSDNNPSGDSQEIVLSMKDYNYYPNTINVKVNSPVTISLDKTVAGCFRDFTIKEFGIRKYLRTPEDTIQFTPTKTGTFTFACSMGMGSGTIIVE